MSAVEQAADPVILDVQDLVVEHRTRRGELVHAVSGVSLHLVAGETLGVVGESGCGKSSLARALMQLPAPTSGSVRLNGVELTGLSRRARRKARQPMQLVFQDSVASLNPLRSASETIAEVLRVTHGREAATDERIRTILEDVGLDPHQVWDRRASQLSGGQCQRLGIGRALAADPMILVCDEPVAALDVSIQAHVLNLIHDAKQRHGLALIFISHDLAVINNVSDRVMVMYLGQVCEIGPVRSVVDDSAHPYTRLLLESDPESPTGVDPRLARAAAVEPPSPLDPPSGCRFRTRCAFADEICATVVPPLTEIGAGHQIACHHPLRRTTARQTPVQEGEAR